MGERISRCARGHAFFRKGLFFTQSGRWIPIFSMTLVTCDRYPIPTPKIGRLLLDHCGIFLPINVLSDAIFLFWGVFSNGGGNRLEDHLKGETFLPMPSQMAFEPECRQGSSRHAPPVRRPPGPIDASKLIDDLALVRKKHFVAEY